MNSSIHLLFAIDDHYVEQFMVTLYSIVTNSSKASFDVYVMQKQPLAQNETIALFCEQLGVSYHPVVMGDDAFKDAPTTDRYPETIYYRLLAHEFLPEDLERILYVDADILCLNDIVPFYEMDLSGKCYAASSHTADSNIPELVNKLRLQNFETDGYYNTGVLLMNLSEIRKTVKRSAILDYIQKKGALLLLPDQDLLNALYGHLVELVPDSIYNYDARYNTLYYARSFGEWDLNWVIEHTVFLHFCGRDKPWKDSYRGRYAALYKHYYHHVRRLSMTL